MVLALLAPMRAEEDHAVSSALSTTTLSGVVDTSSISALQASPVLFEDNFETDSSASWNVFDGAENNTPDFSVQFGFVYTTNSYTSNGVRFTIPPAPNSTSGSSRGVKVAVNKDDVAARAGVNIYPKGKSFSGNYALRFDMWIGYNGGEGGGTGSTEFGIFGINHTGTQVNWAPTAGQPGSLTTSDGVWFAVTGEGGAAGDYRNYEGDAAGAPLRYTGADGGFIDHDGIGGVDDEVVPPQPASSPLSFIFPRPPFETAGVPGKRWVQVEVRQRDSTITWLMDGYVIAEKQNLSPWTQGNIMLGTMDVFASIASPKEDNFVIFDNVRVVDLAASPALPRLTIEATNPSGAEPSTSGSFTVTRDGDTSQPLAIKLRTGGTAVFGKDYAAFPLSTNIPAGAATLSIPLTVLNDQNAEPTETALVALASTIGSYELAGGMVASAEIVDDGDITFVGVNPVDTLAIEGLAGESALFSVFRSGDPTGDLSVNIGFSGTASAADYTAAASPVTIPAGATSVVVKVEITADAVADPDETIVLSVGAGTGYGVDAAAGSATATIKEPGATLFSDAFESDSSANYGIKFSAANGISDYKAEFGFDYSGEGIAPSPRGNGSTKGVRLTVNKNDATASAASVNAYPNGLNVSGDFLLKADMFLTYNTIAAGTTEHAILGVNHSGVLTNRHGSAGSDGVWFAIETDGSASGGRSYVVYTATNATSVPLVEAKPASQFASVFTVPPFLAAGAPSGDWVDVSVRQTGNVITWRVNDTLIARKTNTTSSTSGNIMIGYMDTFNSIGSTNNFVVYDNLRVISLGGGAPTGELKVTSAKVDGQNFVIDFTIPSNLTTFVLEGSPNVNTGYAPETNAQISTVSATVRRATVPLESGNRFFRVRGQ